MLRMNGERLKEGNRGCAFLKMNKYDNYVSELILRPSSQWILVKTATQEVQNISAMTSSVLSFLQFSKQKTRPNLPSVWPWPWQKKIVRVNVTPRPGCCCVWVWELLSHGGWQCYGLGCCDTSHHNEKLLTIILWLWLVMVTCVSLAPLWWWEV